MSYSIQTGIDELEQKLKAERAIAEQFPDAVLDKRCDGQQVWMSPSARGHTTDIELVPAAGEQIHREIVIYPYLAVEGMRVYATNEWISTTHYMWLDALKKKHPEVYKTMVTVATTPR